MLREYSQASAKPVIQAIEDARNKRIETDLDQFLANRFGKNAVPAIKACHEQDEGRPIETLWDVTTAATAFARSRPNTDNRLEIERTAGELLKIYRPPSRPTAREPDPTPGLQRSTREALYDSAAMRRFVGVDLGREPVPDETTVCRFRHLLEAHELGRPLFDEVQRHLAAKRMKVATGTIVDATIVNAPCSTKNAEKARDPEMHQTKKGNQWYSGMKAHFGVDSRSKPIHAVATTPANVADSTVLPELLHGRETRVWGDQAYRGQRAVIREHAPKARDFTNRRYRHRGVVDEVERAKNRTKSKVRARVEHVIGIIKRVFGFAKLRYRGLNKNLHRLLVTCALANLFMARRHLLRSQLA